ncbi:f94fd24e-35be-4c42-a7b2-1ab905a3feaa [Sclerotinia trifoliorum]|uniref:F94fd24e-35be-4c42-a7b2-1ab905a3feaa n=1 Tax=Sclerotinia trifoliorum TaxID=28548 RepID=A0A8H2VR15_9HELO|nr:f94fd24e-35be-4c42-a7b2-1ab905a3feaa [Sclerotinia trifoliorum]
MDFVNKAKDAIKSSSSGSTGTTNTNTNTNTASGAGKEDYGDKGLSFLEKKTGHTLSRDQNEKITDGARNLYEKQTGSKVNSKFSN